MTSETPPIEPILLEPNRPRQFYLAGGAGPVFRRSPAPDEYRPEEWVASTTRRAGATTDGLSRLPDGRWLRDAVTTDPTAWLGPEHVERFGDDVAVLVKLLDAGQRLPVHVHPTRAFARSHLGSLHGKTEAWVIVGTSGGSGDVWLGFRHDQDAVELSGWVAGQQVQALLGALNRLDVRAGDAILVPAGTPHAVGPGVFCVELQEPTDFSLNLEWEGFAVPDGGEGQLGLRPDEVLACVGRSAIGAADIDRLRQHRVTGGVTDLLPAEAAPYFRASRLRPEPEIVMEASFAVLVVTDGEGRLAGESGTALSVRRGDVVLVPWAAGTRRLIGALEVVRCQPPVL